MKYYAHYDRRYNTLSKSNCRCIAEFVENIEIEPNVYKFLENYMYQDGEIVPKSDEQIAQEKAEKERLNEIECIKQELNELDFKSIRALRSNDTEYLMQYENQARELRTRLQEIS